MRHNEKRQKRQKRQKKRRLPHSSAKTDKETALWRFSYRYRPVLIVIALLLVMIFVLSNFGGMHWPLGGRRREWYDDLLEKIRNRPD